MEPRGPEHPQIDGQIDGHHAHVSRHAIQQAAQRQHMEQQQKDGLGAVQPLFAQPAYLKGQQQQEGQLDHLCRLQVEQASRQGEPALVACAVVVAQGDQQQEQPGVDQRQQPPALFQHPAQIHGL